MRKGCEGSRGGAVGKREGLKEVKSDIGGRRGDKRGREWERGRAGER